ncbi:MAG: methyltransferase [Bacteroidetes bacterium]|nr:methyltransferase [Bacteroidota bacterium]
MKGKVRKPFVMKQFTIAHNQVALPVTSDACLFGAVVDLTSNENHEHRVLDIGTGTGLLCFMLAQKHPAATFTGIDIHQESIAQALENQSVNPFADLIQFELSDILTHSPNQPYHSIVCNPPFFENQWPSEDETRRLARHSNTLNLSNLVAACTRILCNQGKLFLLYPCDDLPHTRLTLNNNHFQLLKTTFIKAHSQKKPHLVVIEAQYNPEIPSESIPALSETIIHYTPEGKLTETATHYLKEFYSHLP